MTNEQKEKADKINWWHTIKLADDYTTKGRVGLDHCSPEVITSRFGMPESLKGKTILDVGGWDGLFSFEAEKRGAEHVYMIDCYQGFGENPDGFLFAREVLGSMVLFDYCSLEELSKVTLSSAYDIVLYYGIFYHIENPIIELKHLYKLCREYILLETAIAQNDYNGKSVLEFNYGYDGDDTNKFYPTEFGLVNLLMYVGFNKIEVLYNDGIRLTAKAIK